MKNNFEQYGQLFIVATPIGHFDDMSSRALSVLNDVDLIFAEDKRRSGLLLNHFLIKTPMQSLHDHNETQKAPEVIQLLLEGQSIALISDAGTPLISDPGYKLVNLAVNENIRVTPIPGACALITALSVAGIATDRFCFEGFLPPKVGARKKALSNYITGEVESRTLVFYEAPHRIVATLEDMTEIFGEGHIVTVARELTKLYETLFSGKLSDVLNWIRSDPNQQKGEFVIVVSGFSSHKDLDALSTDAERVLSTLLEELSVKQAVSLAVKLTGEKKKRLYTRALQLTSQN